MADSGWNLRISTLNVFGLAFLSGHRSARMPEIGRALAKRNLDIVLLQEAWLKSDRHLLAKESGMAHSEFFETPGLVGSGLMALSKSPTTKQKFHKFSANGALSLPVRSDMFSQKGVGLIGTKHNDVDLTVLNTHTIARYGKDLQSESDNHSLDRKIQLFEIFRMLIEHGETPNFVIAGDFNIRHFHEEHDFWERLTSLPGHSVEKDDPSIASVCNSNTFIENTCGQVDYLFWSPNLKAKKIDLDFKELVVTKKGISINLSDHYGWTAELTKTTEPAEGSADYVRAQSLQAVEELYRELKDRSRSLLSFKVNKEKILAELAMYRNAIANPGLSNLLSQKLNQYFSYFGG